MMRSRLHTWVSMALLLTGVSLSGEEAWSGGSEPIIAITHVSLFPVVEYGSAEGRVTEQGTGGLTIAFKQVYATHYLTASLSLTSITPAGDGSPRYLVYARRSRADVLGGVFGGIIRKLIERRIRSEAPAALDRLRRKLETEPTQESTSS